MSETIPEIRKAKIELESQLEKLLEDFQAIHNVIIGEVDFDTISLTTLGTGNNKTFKANVRILI